MHKFLVTILFSTLILFVVCVVVLGGLSLVKTLLGIEEEKEIPPLLRPTVDPNEIWCPGCNQEVTASTVTCPNCGSPLEQYYGGKPLKEVLRKQG